MNNRFSDEKMTHRFVFFVMLFCCQDLHWNNSHFLLSLSYNIYKNINVIDDDICIQGTEEEDIRHFPTSNSSL